MLDYQRCALCTLETGKPAEFDIGDLLQLLVVEYLSLGACVYNLAHLGRKERTQMREWTDRLKWWIRWIGWSGGLEE